MFYVYLLQSTVDKKLYTGYTTDLRKRVSEHNQGKNRSTKPRIPLKLMYYEAYISQADAAMREKRLKRSAGARTALRRRLTDGLQSGHFV